MKLVTLKKEYNLILKDNITNYLSPNYIYLPITMDTKLKIDPKNYIYKDDLLFNLIYSPVSGKIIGIKDGCTVKGNTKLLVVENDFKEKQSKKTGIRKNINS